jgi:hypothetical protein
MNTNEKMRMLGLAASVKGFGPGEAGRFGRKLTQMNANGKEENVWGCGFNEKG